MVFLLQEKRIQLARAKGRAWHFSLGGHGLTKIDSSRGLQTLLCASTTGSSRSADIDRSLQSQTSCRTFSANPGPTPHRVQRERSAGTTTMPCCVPVASARWRKLSIPVPAPLKSSPTRCDEVRQMHAGDPRPSRLQFSLWIRREQSPAPPENVPCAVSSPGRSSFRRRPSLLTCNPEGSGLVACVIWASLQPATLAAWQSHARVLPSNRRPPTLLSPASSC